MLKFVLLCTLLCFLAAKCEDVPDTIAELKALIHEVEQNETLNAEFEKHFNYWSTLETDSSSVPKFSCQVAEGRSAQKPTSVHKLRAGDIEVVAAIGDSITAGCGSAAKTAAGILLEWRGRSWSIGGDKSIDEGVYTIPNMIKKFNPNVKGFSTGVIPVLSQDIFKKKAGFNAAVSGAKSKGILAQAKKLVKDIQEAKLENEWKLVTLFIGGNDLCAFCKDEAQYNVGNYKGHLTQTLTYLKDNLPKTLVNVVMMLDLTQLKQANGGFVCGILHRLFCKCASYPASEVANQALIEEAVEYSESITELLTRDASLTNGDQFTVVAQPFLVNQRMPKTKDGKPDLSYFAPDCFHFSLKGHALSAQALWNNMFEPAGRKRLSWFRNEGWDCPSSSNPYIFTYMNSDTFMSSPKQQPKSDGLGSEQSTSRDGENDSFGSYHQQSHGSMQQADNSPDVRLAAGDVDQEKDVVGSSVAPTVVGICAGVIVLAVLIVVVSQKLGKRRQVPNESTGLL